ncbi:MAG: hybrid sensor histidine kinase/response regulator [Cyclobacteriaceae bacterium]
MDLSKLKTAYFEDKSQFVLFEQDGGIKDSCNSLIELDLSTSLYDQMPLIDSIKETFKTLPTDEELNYPCVNHIIDGAIKYFDFHFRRSSKVGKVLWIIIDVTEQYEQLIHVQQERNHAAISEETLSLQRKTLQLEKKILELQNKELQQIQEFKTSFFAKVSHELRTPVSSISGLSKMLTENKNDETISSIQAVSNHLLSIVNDVLDLSKLETGKLDLTPSDFDFRKVIKEVTHSFSYLIKEKNIDLISDIDSSIPNYIHGDYVRLTQLLFNLLSNAIRFTDKGEVKLLIKRKKPGAGIHLFFKVKDSGVGIEKDKVTYIFEPFIQEEANTYQKHGGSGLGLSIVKQLVELQKGNLTIESEKGIGTTIAFDIIYKEAHSDKKRRNKVTPSLTNVSVLLVEDDILNQKVGEQLLIKEGANVVVSSDWFTTLESLKSHSFDLLLLDNTLPDCKAEDIILYIRGLSTGLNSKELPIYILTGGITEEKKTHLKEIGSRAIFFKPLTSKIIKTIQQEIQL